MISQRSAQSSNSMRHLGVLSVSAVFNQLSLASPNGESTRSAFGCRLRTIQQKPPRRRARRDDAEEKPNRYTQLLLGFALLIAVVLSSSSNASAKTLDIYFIDVEGGSATLIVTPSNESILVDSGF